MSNILKPELLSPASTIEGVYAAVNCGCDAVYIGGKKFSARQMADNFTIEQIEEICDYCHLRGVKVFLTVNTAYKEEEIKDLIDFIGETYKIGVDAIIVSDLGIVKYASENFPEINLHASTQLCANNLYDVSTLYESGFNRIVLSRELSFDEIEKITANTDCEIEVFVHGALCVSYSGQCIMSGMLGGRSGNRGRCAQTCRLPFTLQNGNKKVCEGHLLSPKDISTIENLPAIIKSGVSSLKIEGRMKNAEYVAAVTSIYRKYIDLYFENPSEYKVDKQDIKTLNQIFNRGGFTSGYFDNHSSKDMMSFLRPKPWGLKIGFVDKYDPRHKKAMIRTSENLSCGDGIEVWTSDDDYTKNVGTNINKASKRGEVVTVNLEGNIKTNNIIYRTFDKTLMDNLKKLYKSHTRKKSIKAKIEIKANKKVSLIFYDEKFKVEEYLPIPEEAVNNPSTKKTVNKQICKMGNTPFEIVEIDIIIDENVYVKNSDLNDLRRRATAKFEELVMKDSKKDANEVNIVETDCKPVILDKKINVSVSNKLQFDVVVKNSNVNIIYFELNNEFITNLDDCIELASENDVKLFAKLPRIYRDCYEAEFTPLFLKLERSEIDGVMIQSLGEFNVVSKWKKEIAVNYNLNVFNKQNIDFLIEKGASIVTLSPELNISEICEIGNDMCEMVVYGYLPLMTTNQCPVGNFAADKSNKRHCTLRNCEDNFFLKDRKDERFLIKTNCEQCIATIYNGRPLITLKFFDEIVDSPTKYIRLDFLNEKEKEVYDILNAYVEMVDDSSEVCSLALKILEKYPASTKGHYFRGVE